MFWHMRLAAISDIHGNSAALDAVLEDIGTEAVDQIVNLGDCFSGPLDASGTAERLAAVDLVTVRGNHDRLLVDQPKSEMGLWEAWIIDELPETTLEWCRGLPLTYQQDGVFLCHATPGADDENWLDYRGPGARLIARDLSEVEKRAGDVDADVMLCGHTHMPRSVRLPDGRRIVNVGSVGCPAYLDTRMQPNFIQQTGAPDARYAILTKRQDDWIVNLRSVPYDTRDMIRIAEEKDAPNWARALDTAWFV